MGIDKKIPGESGDLNQEKLERQEILNKILPGVEFQGGEYSGYNFSYKGINLDMNFKNFKALETAIKEVARILREYKVKGKITNFYVYTDPFPKLALDDTKFPNILGITLDTTYDVTDVFLSEQNIRNTHKQRSIKPIIDELQKLVDFLNAVKDIP